MCGIVGCINERDESIIQVMNDTQTHRGPDDEGYFVDRVHSVSLAMRRLSIVDIEAGRQPMSNEDHSIVVVFNGEIFNSMALREELVQQGHIFHTDHSDTEVLVHLYEAYDKDMLKRLNGMFAFLIYDKKKKLIFAARDHVGIKPLYYSMKGNTLYFASEMKSIVRTGKVNLDMDQSSLQHYLSLQFVPSPGTIFKNIKKIPAAHYLCYELQRNKITLKRYWEPSFENSIQFDHPALYYDYIYSEFKDAVKRWTMSDVPSCVLLSGGIDSPAIVAAMSEFTNTPISTYTLGFSEESDSSFDERHLARLVSSKYNTDHHEIIISSDHLLTDIDKMVYAMDEPYAGGLPSWYIYKEIGKTTKVAFTGLGGDELFGNYGKWKRYENLRSQLDVIKNQIIGGESIYNILKYYKGNLYHKYYTEALKCKTLLCYEKEASTSNLYQSVINQCKYKNWKDIVPYVDFQYQLPDEFLAVTDRFSMAHSVEARTPFLDIQFVQSVQKIPCKLRSNNETYKRLLIETVRDKLPTELVNAPKKGFSIPIEHWMRTKLKEQIIDYTTGSIINQQNIFSENLERIIVASFFKGKSRYAINLWNIFMFQKWYFYMVG